MISRARLRELIKSYYFVSFAASLVLHLLLFLFQFQSPPPKQVKKKKRQIKAEVKLRMPPQQASEELLITPDSFDDPAQQERKLFKLRKGPAERRDIRIDHDRAFRSLRMPGDWRGQFAAPSQKKGYVPFYMLDQIPRPLTPYNSVVKYPETALAIGLTNTGVVVEFYIATNGQVLLAKKITDSGYGFEDAVVAAASNMRFSPGRVKGHPVNSMLRERILFLASE